MGQYQNYSLQLNLSPEEPHAVSTNSFVRKLFRTVCYFASRTLLYCCFQIANFGFQMLPFSISFAFTNLQHELLPLMDRSLWKMEVAFCFFANLQRVLLPLSDHSLWKMEVAFCFFAFAYRVLLPLSKLLTLVKKC